MWKQCRMLVWLSKCIITAGNANIADRLHTVPVANVVFANYRALRQTAHVSLSISLHVYSPAVREQKAKKDVGKKKWEGVVGVHVFYRGLKCVQSWQTLFFQPLRKDMWKTKHLVMNKERKSASIFLRFTPPPFCQRQDFPQHVK